MNRFRQHSHMAAKIALGVTLTAGVAWPGTVPASASTSAPAGRCTPVAGVTTTDLGTLGGPGTVAFDLNDRGVVVGVSDTDIPTPTITSHAFRWREGVMVDMTPTADYGVASDVNNRGEILFRKNDASGEQMAIWSRRTTTPLPGYASAINDRGEALLNNAVWRRGTVTDILPPDPDHWVVATGLGSRGHVIGTVWPFPGPGGGHPPHDGAFVWRDGTMTVIRVPGLFMPTPVGVDRTGRVLLQAVGDGTRAVLSDGVDHVVLPSLTGAPDASTTAGDINDRGDAVGSSVAASGAQHAVLWRDGRVIDLHTLGTSSVATAIGPNGHVAGTYVAADGTTRAFLWWCGRMTDIGAGGFPITVNARGQVLFNSTLVTPTR
jgi:probable HAF family extracellular repeat protein